MIVIVVETRNRSVDLYFQDEPTAHVVLETIKEGMMEDDRVFLDIQADGTSLATWNDAIESVEMVDVRSHSMMVESAKMEESLASVTGSLN